MAREADGKVSVLVDLRERSTSVGVGDATSGVDHRLLFEAALANGTSDGQIDRVHSIALSVTSGTDYDLSGSLTSLLAGTTTSFVDLVGIMVVNTTAAGGGSILMGGDAASVPLFSAVNDVIVIPAGGCFFWYAPAGIAVTNSTADVLQFASSSGTATGKVILFGRSA